MSKSKSKTFQKGTDFNLMYSWLSSEIRTDDEVSEELKCRLSAKYLITITKYPEKEEKV